MSFIEIQNLHYQYENGFKALNGLNLRIEKGETFGLLGPNGAGKSTAFRVLVGLTKPTKGLALINGQQINSQERTVYKSVGYMPDMTDLFDDFTVEEFLRFFGLCHYIINKEIDERINRLLKKFKISDKKDQLMGNLSKGQKQKACIIRAMLHDPEVLILDEPASGLDPGSRNLLFSILKDEGDNGRTIIISSHILPELADLCTSVGIVSHGRTIEKGRIRELISKYQNPVAKFKINILERIDRAKKILNSISNTKLLTLEEISPNTLVIEYDADEHELANLLEILIKDGVRIVGFEKILKDIETIYREILNE